MKTRFAAAALAAIASLALAACGTSPGAPSGVAAPTASAKVIKTYPLCPEGPVYPCVTLEGGTEGKLYAVWYYRDHSELWTRCATSESTGCIWDTQTPGAPARQRGLLRFVVNE